MFNPRRYPIYRALEERAQGKALRANYTDIAKRFGVMPTTVKRWCETLEQAGYLEITKLTGTHDKLFRLKTPQEAPHA